MVDMQILNETLPVNAQYPVKNNALKVIILLLGFIEQTSWLKLFTGKTWGNFFFSLHFASQHYLRQVLIKTVCSPPQTECLTGGVCPRCAGPASTCGSLLLSLGRGRPHAHTKRVLQWRHAVRRHCRELQTAQLPVGAGAERSAAAGHKRTQVHPLDFSGTHGHQAQWVLRDVKII